jgi:hypothetical protein
MIINHKSKLLIDKFQRKPYQGASPEKAIFLFVGLDANYDLEIEDKPVFQEILEYHEDAVDFWRKYKVHHPFLLPHYKGSGKLYHKNFAEIGFTSDHANLVSFVELMHIPTTGRSKLSVDDLVSNHLRKLNNWIVEGSSEHIFLSAGVIRVMKESKHFSWLTGKSKKVSGSLEIVKEWPKKKVYKHLHFSNYGKFKTQMREEALLIKQLLK